MNAGLAFAAGYNAGYWSNMSATLLNGGSVGDAFKSAIAGGIQGGLTSLASFGIGNHFDTLKPGFGRWLGRAAAHGTVGGLSSAAGGGEFRHGFASSFASTGFTHSSVGQSLAVSSHVAVRVAASAVVGGTVSAIGGGKFANGALTSAFQHIFNQETRRSEETAKKVYIISITKNQCALDDVTGVVYGENLHLDVEAVVNLTADLLEGGYIDDPSQIVYLQAEEWGDLIPNLFNAAHEKAPVFFTSHGGPSGQRKFFGGFYNEKFIRRLLSQQVAMYKEGDGLTPFQPDVFTQKNMRFGGCWMTSSKYDDSRRTGTLSSSEVIKQMSGDIKSYFGD